MVPSNPWGVSVEATGLGPQLHFRHPSAFAQRHVHACPLCWAAFPSCAPLLTCRHKIVNPWLIVIERMRHPRGGQPGHHRREGEGGAGVKGAVARDQLSVPRRGLVSRTPPADQPSLMIL